MDGDLAGNGLQRVPPVFHSLRPLPPGRNRFFSKPNRSIKLWKADNMKAIIPPKIQTAVNALLTKPAVLSPTLRQTVEAYAAGLGGGIRPAGELPAELVDYVNKVALYAYKVTDEDVQGLKDNGYSEDMIFEITLCASLGAGLARLECGLNAIKGSQ